MKYLFRCAVAVMVLSIGVLVIDAWPSADQKLMTQDQVVIDGCWEESRAATITAAQQQRTIEACTKLEEIYRYNHGKSPRPASMPVHPRQAT